MIAPADLPSTWLDRREALQDLIEQGFRSGLDKAELRCRGFAGEARDIEMHRLGQLFVCLLADTIGPLDMIFATEMHAAFLAALENRIGAQPH